MAKTKNPHFDDKFISEQKNLLLKIREQTINDIGQKSNEDLHVDSDEVIEDGDQAQTYLNQNLSFGLRERELHKLREIEAALGRIEEGSTEFAKNLKNQSLKKGFKKYHGQDYVLKLLSN